MSNASLSKFEQRMVRGRILFALDVNYPHEINSRIIWNALSDAGFNISQAQVEANLIYLEQKAYITTSRAKDDVFGIDMTCAKLTPKGKDLVDGYIPADPGVCFK